MSSEILRRAAERVRLDIDSGAFLESDDFGFAVADLLDHAADVYEQHRASATTSSLRVAPALAVASAYLGEAS